MKRRGATVARRVGLLCAVPCAAIWAAGWAAEARAQTTYYVNGGAPGAERASGVQLQIGNGLPLPIQRATTDGASTGITALGGTVCRPNCPIGTGTHVPPLRIPPATPPPTVMQTGSFPHTLRVPLSVFGRVPSEPTFQGLARQNAGIWQIRTNLSFQGPGFPNNPPGSSAGPRTNNPPGTGAASATFSAGRRTGARTAAFSGPTTGSKVVYSRSLNQFGGPAQLRVALLSPLLLWVPTAAEAPCKHNLLMGDDPGCVALLAQAQPGSRVAFGGPVGFTTVTPGKPPIKPGALAVNVTSGGLILSQTTVGIVGVPNKATSSGFPWTTGMLTIDDGGGALATPERFVITGMDGRSPGGAGTLSLVSAALSNRFLTGPNANRGWIRYVLPEPSALLGAAAALAALGLCHALDRR